MRQVIWEAELDEGKYDCKVVRVDDSSGYLTVHERESGNQVIGEPVSLSYGATFGPDAIDVAQWQELISLRIPE